MPEEPLSFADILRKIDQEMPVRSFAQCVNCGVHWEARSMRGVLCPLCYRGPSANRGRNRQ